MAKVNPDRLGGSAPKVTQDDLEEDVAVLHIAGYEEDEIDDDSREGGKRATAFLLFDELGDKRLYLNKTAAATLVTQYGPDSDLWMGKPCPVEKVRRKFGNKTFDKVDVVPSEEWEEYVEVPKPRRVKKSVKRGK